MSIEAGRALQALDGSSVSAGPLGLLVVVLMIIATVLLIRNMNGRLRRLPRQFPDEAERTREDGGPGSSSSA